MASSPWAPSQGQTHHPWLYIIADRHLGELRPVAPALGSHVAALWCQDPERTGEATGVPGGLPAVNPRQGWTFWGAKFCSPSNQLKPDVRPS